MESRFGMESDKDLKWADERNCSERTSKEEVDSNAEGWT
jgi:hypothetical protein